MRIRLSMGVAALAVCAVVSSVTAAEEASPGAHVEAVRSSVAVTAAVSDTVKPTVSIASPSAGAVVSGSVTIVARASDNVAVKSVSFWATTVKVGEGLQRPDGTWALSVDTRTWPNATYTVTAKATDAAGNVGTSAGVALTLKNSATPSPSAVPTPTAEWRFTEPVAPFFSTASDLPLMQAGPVKATAVSTPWGRGIKLSGQSFLRIPKEAVGRLNIGASHNTVTVAAWVYTTDQNAGFVAGAWREDRLDPRRSYGLFYDLASYGGDERSNFHVSKSGGPTPGYPHSRDYSASGQKFTRSVWQLHVGTYDGTFAVSYLNGVAVAYPTYKDSLGNTYAKNPYYYPDGLNAVPSEFTVGAVQLSTGPGNLAIGTFAGIRVWDRALTASQVKALYDQEKPAP